MKTASQKEMETQNQKKLGCSGLGCLSLLVVFLGLRVWDMWPKTTSAVSPDGRFTAGVTATSGFWDITDLGMMHFYLTNNTTGEKVKIAEQDAGGVMDGEVPVDVIWKSDSQRFACILKETELNSLNRDKYKLQLHPLTVHEDKDMDGWLKDELTRRAMGSSGEQQEQAKELLNRIRGL